MAETGHGDHDLGNFALSAAPFVEEIIDALRHLRADAVDRLEIVDTGARYCFRRAEMLEERALASRADAGNLVEGIGADGLAALGAVRADDETMGLVPQPLHEVEHR